MAKPIRKYVKAVFAIAILAAAVAWLADWLLLLRNKADGFGQVEVHRRFAIHLKNRQIEQRMEKPHLQGCVHSIFPHYRQAPCWYLVRHANDLQDVDGSPWHFWDDDRP